MHKIDDIRILEHIGLTRNEAIVYIGLLAAGNSIGKDISKITNMHRTSVYGCLQRLQKKGLVIVSATGKKAHFEAVDPSKLLSLVKEREERLLKLLPNLKKLRQLKSSGTHEVQYLKGKQGLKSVFDEIINEGKHYVGWGPQRKIETLLKYYFLHYVKIRKEKHIKGKLIYFNEPKNPSDTSSPLLEVRHLKKVFYSPIAHRVYGNNVAILMLEDEPLVIIIRNKAIADSYRKHFDLLWHMAVR